MDHMTALYFPTLLGFLAIGILLLLQLVIADVTAVRAGHVPGAPVDATRASKVFRAHRAHANTNESRCLST